MLETVRLFIDYTCWADGRMFDAVSTLTPDQWTKDLGSSLKSVRDTVVHLVGAEWLYGSRFRGVSPEATWSAADHPTPASIREPWEFVMKELSSFAAAQTEVSLRKPLSYRNLKGEAIRHPLGEVILQMTNHSTYHRGQVTTLLRQLGARPVSTDLILFCGERAKQP